jgi:hypothetical protein
MFLDMKKKKAKKNSRMNAKCAERDRLWAAFLKVGKEWEAIKSKMRQMHRHEGVFELDLAKVEDIKNRLETTHKLFGKHIGKHRCWQPKVSLLKRKKTMRISSK